MNILSRVRSYKLLNIYNGVFECKITLEFNTSISIENLSVFKVNLL